MNIWWHIAQLFIFGLVLSASASLVVRTVSVVASVLRLGSFTIGFLLLGLTTSTPELFVASQSIIDGVPQLAVGNLLGGSIMLVSFIIGTLAVFLGRIRIDHEFRWNDMMALCAVIASPVVVLWDGNLTRVDGIFLIGMYMLYAFLINKEQKIIPNLERRVKKLKHPASIVLRLGMGIVGLSIASRVIIQNAELLTEGLGISRLIFGLFILSLGTNLPELALAVTSIMRRRTNIAFGDFLGSSAANTMLLGVVGVASPFQSMQSDRLIIALLFLGSVTAYLLWTLRSGRMITRREGLGLLFFFFLFIAYEFFG